MTHTRRQVERLATMMRLLGDRLFSRRDLHEQLSGLLTVACGLGPGSTLAIRVDTVANQGGVVDSSRLSIADPTGRPMLKPGKDS